MRRLFLPLLIGALWLASLAGAGWMRAQCVQACAQAVAVAQAGAAEEAETPPCCARHRVEARRDDCTPADCSKCRALAEALLAVAPAPDAPLFFDASCGRLEPVAVMADPACASPARPWRWSLPPPGTLLALHCQLII